MSLPLHLPSVSGETQITKKPTRDDMDRIKIIGLISNQHQHSQMAVEENMLQFINERAMSNVKAFISNTTKKNMPYLACSILVGVCSSIHGSR